MSVRNDLIWQGEHIIELANKEALRLKCNYVGTEHILLALVADKDSMVTKILSDCGIKQQKVQEAVEFLAGRGDNNRGAKVRLAPRSERVIELAQLEACMLGSSYCGSEHLLLGILRERSGVAASVLENFGGTSLYTKVRNILRGKCPRCGAKITAAIIDYPLVLKGMIIMLRNVPAEVCSQCKEIVEIKLNPELEEKIRDLVESDALPFEVVKMPVCNLVDVH